jgi:hypothetical protein
LDPAADATGVNEQTTFERHLGHVRKGDRKPQVPPHAPENDIARMVTPFEWIRRGDGQVSPYQILLPVFATIPSIDIMPQGDGCTPNTAISPGGILPRRVHDQHQNDPETNYHVSRYAAAKYHLLAIRACLFGGEVDYGSLECKNDFAWITRRIN